MAKLAASTNAQARYLFPFLVLPWPFFLRLLILRLSTHRQYEAKFPTLANLPMFPVSSMMVSARISPIPGTVLRNLNCGLSWTRWRMVCSSSSTCSSALNITATLALTARARSPSGNSRSTCWTSSPLTWLAFIDDPVLRVKRFWMLHTWVVRWRTSWLRLRNRSRTGKSLGSEFGVRQTFSTFFAVVPSSSYREAFPRHRATPVFAPTPLPVFLDLYSTPLTLAVTPSLARDWST